MEATAKLPSSRSSNRTLAPRIPCWRANRCRLLIIPRVLEGMIMLVLACGILLAGLETGALDEFDLEAGGSGHVRDVDRRTIGQRGHSRLDENRYALAAQAFDVLS